VAYQKTMKTICAVLPFRTNLNNLEIVTSSLQHNSYINVYTDRQEVVLAICFTALACVTTPGVARSLCDG